MSKSVERKESGIIADEIKEAVSEIMKKHGLAVKIELIKYGYQFKCAVIGIVADDGMSAEQTEFNQYCVMHGFKPEDFGRVVKMWDGKEYRIVGIRPKARKNSISIENVVTGKRYCCAKSTLRMDEAHA